MFDTLDIKIRKVFGDLAVNKGLARIGVVTRLPRFISEYLISKYCKGGSGKKCLSKVAKIVSEYYPDPKEKDYVLGKIKQKGRITLIDEFRVRVDLRRNMYFLHIPCLQINDALVDDKIIEEYERIFSGLWGIGVLEYVPGFLNTAFNLRKKMIFTPIMLTDFEPFQVYNIDLNILVEGRGDFTLSEWMDVIVKSIGLNPKRYTYGQKMLILFRILPLIEGNVNLLELGPRATGKTYLYRNITYYSRIYAGGIVSPARLFFDARIKIPGDIATKDVVVFDEISKVKFSNPDEMVAKLKDYMVDGFFERATLKRAHSDCSLVFLGNIDLEVTHRIGSVLNYLPIFMRDSAFMDRIHGIIPGWELPKIMKSEEHLATGYGLASDYLSEVFHRFRKISFRNIVDQHFELIGPYTIRDEEGVKRLLSGVMKLMFPHCEFDLSELYNIANITVELRQKISDLLTIVSPKEFPSKKLEIKVRG